MTVLVVEQALISRLTGDSTLQSLLTGSGRIYHGLEIPIPKVPSVTYINEVNTPLDSFRADIIGPMEEYYRFNVFADNYEAVVERIYRLLHQYSFPALSGMTIKSCVWDWTGPDEFDEKLQVGSKMIRFKIIVIRSAQEPV